MAICAGMAEFADALGAIDLPPRDAGAAAHAEWQAWSTPQLRAIAMDLGPCVAAMRAALPADTIVCNGAGNYSGWWHRYWPYAGPGTQLAPTAGAMGYGVPAAIAAALRHPDRMVVALAGDGCFLMNGQDLATAVQHDAQMLVIVVDGGADHHVFGCHEIGLVLALGLRVETAATIYLVASVWDGLVSFAVGVLVDRRGAAADHRRRDLLRRQGQHAAGVFHGAHRRRRRRHQAVRAGLTASFPGLSRGRHRGRIEAGPRPVRRGAP